MKIKIDNGLILCSLTLIHHGIEQVVHNLVLDTGASETLIYRHAAKNLDIYLEPDDEFVFMRGIGGRKPPMKKGIDSIRFGDFTLFHFPIDFGDAEAESGINGLLGLDILSSGKFIIDLGRMTIY